MSAGVYRECVANEKLVSPGHGRARRSVNRWLRLLLKPDGDGTLLTLTQ